LEAEQAKDELKDLEIWRKKGPVGKLHNIVKYIGGSGQRQQVFEKIQKLQNLGLDEEATTYQLVEDQETRWNSSYSMMERAVLLRGAIDTYMINIIKEYDDYIAKITRNNTRPLPKRHQPKPAICDSHLSTDDWSILTEYLVILKPFKMATKRLEGRAVDGECDSLVSFSNKTR
jgi:hypothetical protein